MEHPHGQGGDQQGQRAVKSAGEAHHGAPGPGVLQALLQPQGRDSQNLLAAVGPVGGVLRDEGRGGDIAADLGLAQGKFRLVAVQVRRTGSRRGRSRSPG